jgi:hypothetical protein
LLYSGKRLVNARAQQQNGRLAARGKGATRCEARSRIPIENAEEAETRLILCFSDRRSAFSAISQAVFRFTTAC